jgi:L-2-hydroxyglutarate oxidase LhgO
VLNLDAVVIGAGVVGLAVARALARSGREVVVLEAEPTFGTHTSSRNSEVIHAGIYYPTGSLKARLCVAGKHALYAYCAENDVAHARLGKLIVATRDDQIPVLEKLLVQARENAVHDLVWLEAAEVRKLEPAVSCVRALHSPSTGIVDSHGFMAALKRDAERASAQIVFSSPVLSGRILGDRIELSIGGSDPVTILCTSVVNAAGLFAQKVSRSLAGLNEGSIPPAFLAKGHYFVLRGKSPFSRLVYPVPEPGGLGVHVTLDLSGQARFGPDVSWIDALDYSLDEARAAAFYPAIQRYFPALAPGSLDPGYTGIRPKLGPSGSPPHDFLVQGPREHGVRGLVNLYGIESPGLTAALALADLVTGLLDGATAPRCGAEP